MGFVLRTSLTLAAFTLMTLGSGAFLQYHFVKDHLKALQIQNLILEATEYQPRFVTIEEVRALGYESDSITHFFENQNLPFLGEIADKGISAEIGYFYRLENGKVAMISKPFSASDTLAQSQNSIALYWASAFFFIFGLTAVLLRVSLRPLNRLERATQNIIAGNYDITESYKRKDAIGQTFAALKRLCQELEAKDKALEAVSELATVDGMTGLKNHRSFKEELVRQVLTAKRASNTLGLILLDVDHFKKFNDTYGHQQGDEVLRWVAKKLMETARRTDFVCRYGGEEFVIIAPDTNFEGLKVIVEKLRSGIEKMKVPDINRAGNVLSVTSSFGAISVAPSKISDSNENTLKAYIEACDKNLYQAKKSGRNCATFSEL